MVRPHKGIRDGAVFASGLREAARPGCAAGKRHGLEVASVVAVGGRRAVARHSVLGRHAARAAADVTGVVERSELVQSLHGSAVADRDRLVLVVADDDAVLDGTLQRVHPHPRRGATTRPTVSDDGHGAFVAPLVASAREQHARDGEYDQ